VLATSHAALYLASKLTETPAKPRNIINVTTYLLKTPSASPISSKEAPADVDLDEACYVDEHTYLYHRTRLLDMETEILKALGYQTHTALPYALTINYVQTLDCLTKPLLLRCFGYLTDALLSPSMLYLTHQPNALAAAALYLAARDEKVKLPEGWWEIFDVEREDLGFLVAGMKGVEEFVRSQVDAWGDRIPWDEKELEAVVRKRLDTE
jgi:hypothetical protein